MRDAFENTSTLKPSFSLDSLDCRAGVESATSSGPLEVVETLLFRPGMTTQNPVVVQMTSGQGSDGDCVCRVGDVSMFKSPRNGTRETRQIEVLSFRLSRCAGMVRALANYRLPLLPKAPSRLHCNLLKPRRLQ